MKLPNQFSRLTRTTFQSNAELRAAVEKIIGRQPNDNEWYQAKPVYGPPYGQMSLEETLFPFGYYIQREKRKKRKIRWLGDRKDLDSWLRLFDGYLRNNFLCPAGYDFKLAL